jgi:thiosulfate/3-mercaptopyruvate sulfurtransferase
MTAYTTLIEAAELRVFAGPLLICDCRFDLADPAAGAAAYAEGHIPGAVYLSLDGDLSGAANGLNGRHPLPDREVLAARLAALGAGPDTQVVAYDTADSMYAARLWWLLRWLGVPRVAVLNGGLASWRRAGFAISLEAPGPRPPGALRAGKPQTTTISYAALRDANPAPLVIDARAPDRFRGETEPLDRQAGHIPSARNRFFRENLGPDGRFKPADELRVAYLSVLAGTPAAGTVASCGSGVTACHNLLAMELAGLPGAALYPGSWSEWSAQPGALIETG